MTDWTGQSFVVVDVEGNGQQPPDLVELAAVPVVDGVIGEPVSWLVASASTQPWSVTVQRHRRRSPRHPPIRSRCDGSVGIRGGLVGWSAPGCPPIPAPLRCPGGNGSWSRGPEGLDRARGLGLVCLGREGAAIFR